MALLFTACNFNKDVASDNNVADLSSSGISEADWPYADFPIPENDVSLVDENEAPYTQKYFRIENEKSTAIVDRDGKVILSSNKGVDFKVICDVVSNNPSYLVKYGNNNGIREESLYSLDGDFIKSFENVYITSTIGSFIC